MSICWGQTDIRMEGLRNPRVLRKLGLVALPLFRIQTSLGIALAYAIGFHRYQSTSRGAFLRHAAVILVGYFLAIVIGFRLCKYRITSESPRSKPSSRDFLIGEQPNPWDLIFC
jgi:hypothetical protein